MRVLLGALVVLIVAGAAGLLAASARDEDGSIVTTGPVLPTPTASPIPTPGPLLPAPELPPPAWTRIAGKDAVSGHAYVADTRNGDLWRLDPETFPRGAPGASFVAWSPEGEAVIEVRAGQGGLLYSALFSAVPGEEFRLFGPVLPFSTDHLSWSPDGSMMAASGTRSDGAPVVTVVDLEAFDSELEARGRFGAWSADGSFYTITTDRGDLEVWSAEGGPVASIYAAESAWSHDGARLAYVPEPPSWSDLFATSELRVRDFIIFQEKLIMSVDGRTSGISWSVDDAMIDLTYFGLGTGQSRISIIDVDTSTVVFDVLGANSAGWSPARNTLLLEGEFCRSFDIFTADESGSLRNLTDSRATDIDAHWSPNGSAIVFQTYRQNSAEIRLLTAFDEQAESIATLAFTEIEYRAWSPDGSYVAFDYGGGRFLCEGSPGEQPTIVEFPS